MQLEDMTREALVAEVRRLRERTCQHIEAGELNAISDLRVERDAARAEAEELRQAYRTVCDYAEQHDATRANLNEARAELDRLRAEVGRVREALQAVRDWAEANHGGAARPIDIWPGLKAALDAGLGDPE